MEPTLPWWLQEQLQELSRRVSAQHSPCRSHRTRVHAATLLGSAKGSGAHVTRGHRDSRCLRVNQAGQCATQGAPRHQPPCPGSSPGTVHMECSPTGEGHRTRPCPRLAGPLLSAGVLAPGLPWAASAHRPPQSPTLACSVNNMHTVPAPGGPWTLGCAPVVRAQPSWWAEHQFPGTHHREGACSTALHRGPR